MQSSLFKLRERERGSIEDILLFCVLLMDRGKESRQRTSIKLNKGDHAALFLSFGLFYLTEIRAHTLERERGRRHGGKL